MTLNEGERVVLALDMREVGSDEIDAKHLARVADLGIRDFEAVGLKPELLAGQINEIRRSRPTSISRGLSTYRSRLRRTCRQRKPRCASMSSLFFEAIV